MVSAQLLEEGSNDPLAVLSASLSHDSYSIYHKNQTIVSSAYRITDFLFHVDRRPSVGHSKDLQCVVASLTTWIQDGHPTNANTIPAAFNRMVIYMYS
jgi:hypothetical protein